MLEEKGHKENTAKKHLRHVKSFFENAVEDGYLDSNPFKTKSLSVTQTAATKSYVPRSVIAQVIERTANPEWKLLFQFCRSIPLRIPSEIVGLKWNDIDWEKNKILIRSPKTEHHETGDSRMVPLFAELKALLDTAYFSDSESEYILPTIRLNSNPATYAKKLVENAKESVWSNFFNSLRASTETDLMDEYGLRKACQWSGNSASTAMRNYALVRKEDFVDAGSENRQTKSDAKSDAIDAKSAAESASKAEHAESTAQQKTVSTRNSRGFEYGQMGDTGLEPVTPCL